MNCEPCTHHKLVPKMMVTPAAKITNEEIIKRASEFSRISIAQILGRTRYRPICDIRHMVMLIIYNYSNLKDRYIAEIMCKDRTSVIAGREKIKTLITIDAELKKKFEDLNLYIFKYQKTIQ